MIEEKTQEAYFGERLVDTWPFTVLPAAPLSMKNVRGLYMLNAF